MAETEGFWLEYDGKRNGPLSRADVIRLTEAGALDENSVLTDRNGEPVPLKKAAGTKKERKAVMYEYNRRFWVRSGKEENKLLKVPLLWLRALAVWALVITAVVCFGFVKAHELEKDVSAMPFSAIEDLYKSGRVSYSVKTDEKTETERFVYRFDGGKRTFVVISGYPALLRVDFNKPCSEEDALKALDISREGEPERAEIKGEAGKSDRIEYTDYNPRVPRVTLYAAGGKVFAALTRFRVKVEQ